MSGMTKQNLFVFHTRMQPILFKDSANRGQYKINSFIFIVEVQPILSKDSANRGQYKIKEAQLYIFLIIGMYSCAFNII